jgi:hypothetical protein
MKLPSDLRFHSDIRLMVFRPHGILDEKRINEVVRFVEDEEAHMDRPFNRFTDLTQLDAIDLEFESLFRIALHRRLAYSQYPPAKSAFFVANKAAARIVKVPVLLTDHSPLQVKMFWDLAEAGTWLDVPKERLESDEI